MGRLVLPNPAAAQQHGLQDFLKRTAPDRGGA